MKADLTEKVYILDRSGSMSGLESDTIVGFNAKIEKQKSEVGAVNVTTILFDDCLELLHNRVPIQGVSKLTEKDYTVRGSALLLDFIGKAINKIDNVQKSTSDALQLLK